MAAVKGKAKPSVRLRLRVESCGCDPENNDAVTIHVWGARVRPYAECPICFRALEVQEYEITPSWPSLRQEPSSQSVADEALASGGDQPADVVSEAGRLADLERRVTDLELAAPVLPVAGGATSLPGTEGKADPAPIPTTPAMPPAKAKRRGRPYKGKPWLEEGISRSSYYRVIKEANAKLRTEQTASK